MGLKNGTVRYKAALLTAGRGSYVPLGFGWRSARLTVR
jgi:hypothetical protein